MKRPRGRAERRAARRARGERGAVLVEAAFVLPVLVALVMGIIDFGFTFNDWISVRQGARDGLRQVIVNANPAAPGGGSCGTMTGVPATPAEDRSTVCFTKARVALDNTRTAVSVYFASGSFNAGQPVKVCVQYETSSMTGAYSAVLDNKILDTEVESLIEQTNNNLTDPFAETAFPDGHAIKPWSSLGCTSL